MRMAKSHVLMLLYTILIASSFPITANVTHEIHPISLNLLRFLIAVIALTPFLLSIPSARKAVSKTIVKGFILGFFYCSFFVLMFMSLKYTSVLNTGTIHTMTPFITALVSAFILKYRIKKVELVAYLVGIVGTLWVIFKGDLQALLGLHLNYGDGLFFVGVLCAAFYIVLMKYFTKPGEILAMMFSSLVGGAVIMLTTMLVFKIPFYWDKLPKDEYSNILFLAIGTTLLTAYIIQQASPHLTPSKISAYIYLTPACVLVINAIYYNHLPKVILLPGIVLSVVATFLLQKYGDSDIKKVRS
ncbi:EamA family transporter [Shewanella sp. OPT22]|nr:EamA family transporter [Shewanella sp. OPT22]